MWRQLVVVRQRPRGGLRVLPTATPPRAIVASPFAVSPGVCACLRVGRRELMTSRTWRFPRALGSADVMVSAPCQWTTTLRAYATEAPPTTPSTQEPTTPSTNERAIRLDKLEQVQEQEPETEQEQVPAETKKPRSAAQLRFLHAKYKGEQRLEAKRFDRLVPALQRFRELHGHVVVPYMFKVPASSPEWPIELAGYRLGRQLGSLLDSDQQRERHGHVVEEVAALGVDVSKSWRRFVWEESILAALATYRRLYGDLLVPKRFVVPSDDEEWPRATWGLRLGGKIDSLRQRQDVSEVERAELSALGFVWDVSEHKWSTLILPALRGHHDVFGHCLVAINYVVPEDVRWPKESWGLRLGTVVQSMRSSGAYESQVERDEAELARLGFVWDVNEHKWSKVVLPALKVFREVFGHCCVPQNFVVPEDEKWTQESWGLRLGTFVINLRGNGRFKVQVDRDRAELERLGFVWDALDHNWTNVLLPCFRRFHELHGHCDIPLTFIVPSEEGWPREGWGQHLGAIVKNIRCHDHHSRFVQRDREELKRLGVRTERPTNSGSQNTGNH